MKAPVGIAGLGVHVPSQRMSAQELAERTGIPEAVVREKFGLVEKPIAGSDEHVSEMASEAARRALADASVRLGRQVTPAELDGIVYFGSPHKEYPVWLAAPNIQRLLGANRAWAFEVCAVSAGAPFALRVAADMMALDERLRIVLLVAASRESMLLDYTNARSRFMFNFADGAVAAVLVRDWPQNVILASAYLTDGSFSHFVKVPAGGSRMPASFETVHRRLHHLDVEDPETMKRRLDPVSLERFIGVAREAVHRSGRSWEDVGFLAPLHTKRSLFEALVAGLGLRPDQSVYLDRYGHISAADPLIALWEGERLGRLRPGMLAVVLSAGTGYTWGAIAIAWGPMNECRKTTAAFEPR